VLPELLPIVVEFQKFLQWGKDTLSSLLLGRQLHVKLMDAVGKKVRLVMLGVADCISWQDDSQTRGPVGER